MNPIILTIALFAASSQDYAHVTITTTNNNPLHWYSLQRSTDLMNWTVIEEYNCGSTVAQEIDYEILPQAFYRVQDLGTYSPI